jgi:hypothetical protein
MKRVLLVLGVCLMALGTIWILQGINVLPGSFMTGQIQWAYRGAAIAAVGLIVLIVGRRK